MVNSVVHENEITTSTAFEGHFLNTDYCHPMHCDAFLRQQVVDSTGTGVKLRFSAKQRGLTKLDSMIIAGSKTPQNGVLRAIRFAVRQRPVRIGVHNTVASGELNRSIDLEKLSSHYRANPTSNFPGVPMTIDNKDGVGRTTVSLQFEYRIRQLANAF